MNKLLSSVTGGKTPLKIWSGGAAQDYILLRIFGCPTYFRVKEGKLNPRVKKFVFLSVKRNLKCYKLWDRKDKKFVLSRYVMFNKTPMLRPNSQHVESIKTRVVSQ